MKNTYTASFHNGGRKTSKNGNDVKNPWQACREHNIREQSYVKKQKHIDQYGIEGIDYEIWKDMTWKDAYRELFSEAIEKYNSKQKRSDRKIKDSNEYLEMIKRHKMKVPVYESIVTVGNARNLPENPKVVKKIYKEFVKNWEKQYPNLKIIGVYYHADESRERGIKYDKRNERVRGAPHIHIDWIPVETNRQESFDKGNRLNEDGKKTKYLRGMDVENSLTGAFAQMNIFAQKLSPKAAAKKGLHRREKKFKAPKLQEVYENFLNSRDTDSREYYPVMFWENEQRETLKRICKKHGIMIRNPDDCREHLDTDEYAQEQSVGETIKYTRQLTIDLENEKSNLKTKSMELEESKNKYDEGIRKNQARELELLQLKNEEEEKLAYEIEQNKNLLERISEEKKSLSKIQSDTNLQIQKAREQVEGEIRKKLDSERAKFETERSEKDAALKKREKEIADKEKNFLDATWKQFEKTVIPDTEGDEFEIPKPIAKSTPWNVYNSARVVLAKLRGYFSEKIKTLKSTISELKEKVTELQKDSDELKELKKPFRKEWELGNEGSLYLELPYGGKKALDTLADIIYSWETDTPENNAEKTREHRRKREQNLIKVKVK